MAHIVVRRASAEDAESVGGLAGEFADYLRALGDESDLKFDAAAYLRDGFGPEPAFSGLVAEHEGEVVGYLLHHPGYDVDDSARTLHVADLYVRDVWRGRGVGRALMDEAGRVCRGAGGRRMFWSVYAPNQPALRFYERLGARLTRDMLFMRLDL